MVNQSDPPEESLPTRGPEDIDSESVPDPGSDSDSGSGSDSGSDSDSDSDSDFIYRHLVPEGAEFEQEMFSVLDEHDVAREYVKKVSCIPASSAELKEYLASNGSIREEENTKWIDALVQANLRLPVWVARNFADRGVPVMEIIEAGNAGLRQAAEKYDTERGYQFPIYAMWFIRQSITRAVANYHRGLANSSDLQIQRTREYDDRTVFAGANDSKDSEKDGKKNFVKQFASRDEIKEILAKLSPRERDVLRMRFGIDDGTPRALEEVADLYGMTRERVRQIEAAALRKLRPAHRSRKNGAAPTKRAPIKRIGRGQFRAVLAKLEEREAEIMRYKWGFFDGEIRSIAETAEKFSLSIEEVELLEAKALNMVSDI